MWYAIMSEDVEDSLPAARCEHFFTTLLRDLAAHKILDSAALRDEYATLIDAVRTREIDPYSAAERLVAAFELRLTGGAS